MTAFEKWEGLGNDFVVVRRARRDDPMDVDWVRRVCDRRRGVGADGVLYVTDGTSEERPSMVVFNADGSRPEMCGNGLRCVAASLTEEDHERELVVDTDAGPRRCVVTRRLDDAFVMVEMGRAAHGEDLVLIGPVGPARFYRESMGNPHAIDFVRIGEAISNAPERTLQRADLDREAPFVERAVPGNTNVEYVQTVDDGFDVVVWERGVGYTLACGTGACAVAAVACRTGRAPFDQPLRVGLPGGDLEIQVSSDFEIRMRGPARRVFAGAVPRR
ncbi:MAG: diaminopimelate epimerase [Polyangiaceae bacterium]